MTNKFEITPDGLPYDPIYRNIASGMPNEIEVIQLIQPNAYRQPAFVKLDKKYINKAKQLNLVFYVELDANNMVLLWGKQMDTSIEHLEIAINGPGPKTPITMMKKLIDTF